MAARKSRVGHAMTTPKTRRPRLHHPHSEAVRAAARTLLHEKA